MASEVAGSWLIEAAVGTITAIAVEIANALFFENSHAGIALAVALAIGGFLFVVQRGAIERELERKLQPLRQLERYLDLNQNAEYSTISKLAERYALITEPEFQPVKQQMVAEVAEGLGLLATSKRSTTLETGEYYSWLFRQFRQLKKGEYVHAVSVSSEEEWNDSQLEKNFLAENIRAGERGVNVTRIFVVSNTQIADFVNSSPIKAHTVESRDPLVGYWVPLEQLKRYNPGLLTAIRDGFIDFNGRVGLEDKFDDAVGPSGAVRGEVTMNERDLRRMLSNYESLIGMAKELSQGLKGL